MASEQEEDIRIRFGRRVRQLRQPEACLRRILASNAAWIAPIYAGIERGMRNVSLRNIEALARGLGISISELFVDIQ